VNVPSPISRSKQRKRDITESLDAVFPEEEFAPLLEKRVVPLLDLIREVLAGDDGPVIPKRVISAIEDEAHDVETFLDDYDARSNRTFAAITEFIACARGFAELDHTVQHIVSRFASYHPGKPSNLDAAFLDEATDTLEFADRSLKKLLDATLVEAAAISKRRARRGRARKDPPERLPRFRLPHDIDELATLNDDQKIAELASLFLAHKHTLDKLSDCKRFDDVAEMRRYVLDVSDEEQCRYFQTKIHNLQSKYDTFVKSTDVEKKDPDLKRFRGFVSITLHLIECMTQLVHFYERHENDIRAEHLKDRVAALVDKDRVLDRALNFCLFFAHSYLNAGAALAEDLVKRYTTQARMALELPEGVVLHIRPASLIADIVKHHGTPVKVTIGNETKYAGSVLDILMSAGSNTAERTLTFEGDRRPLDDLRLLFAHRLGEDGFASFPQQIAYLRPGS
jgi:hypothetical protein